MTVATGDDDPAADHTEQAEEGREGEGRKQKLVPFQRGILNRFGIGIGVGLCYIYVELLKYILFHLV